MFAGENTLSLVFRLLNFGVLVALFGYLFKRYAWVSIKKQMAANEAFLQDLKQQRENLKGQQKVAERQFSEQEALVSELGLKIERWNAQFDQDQQQRFQEQERIKIRLNKKAALQTEQIALERAQRAVMPHLQQQVTNQLAQKYAQADQSKEFMEKLCAFMEHGKL